MDVQPLATQCFATSNTWKQGTHVIVVVPKGTFKSSSSQPVLSPTPASSSSIRLQGFSEAWNTASIVR